MHKIVKLKKQRKVIVNLDISKLNKNISESKVKDKSKKSDKDLKKVDNNVNISRVIEESDFQNFVSFFNQGAVRQPKVTERPIENIETELGGANVGENGEKKDEEVKYFDVKSNYSSQINPAGNYQTINGNNWNPAIMDGVKEIRTGEIETIGQRRNTNFVNPDSNKMTDDYNKPNENYETKGNIKEFENERDMPGERRKSRF